MSNLNDDFRRDCMEAKASGLDETLVNLGYPQSVIRKIAGQPIAVKICAELLTHDEMLKLTQIGEPKKLRGKKYEVLCCNAEQLRVSPGASVLLICGDTLRRFRPTGRVREAEGKQFVDTDDVRSVDCVAIELEIV